MRIAILGWGSLIWDRRSDFDDAVTEWRFDGPELPLEFSRVSKARGNALTLVIDKLNGSNCQVAYADSKRQCADDAIADLKCREGTVLKWIGYHFSDGTRNGEPEAHNSIKEWAIKKAIEVVIWTGLPSNFSENAQTPFSIDAAVAHLQSLPPEGKAQAAEYFWRAPNFIKTKLREAVEVEPWFPKAQMA